MINASNGGGSRFMSVGSALSRGSIGGSIGTYSGDRYRDNSTQKQKSESCRLNFSTNSGFRN